MPQHHDTTADRQHNRSVAHHISPGGVSMPAVPFVQRRPAAEAVPIATNDHEDMPVQRFSLPEATGAPRRKDHLRTDIAPVQGVFYWDDHPDEHVGTNDNKNAKGIKVFTKSGTFQKNFLRYVHDELLDMQNIRDKDIEEVLDKKFESSDEISLGNKGPNLVDPLVKWFRDNLETLSEAFHFVPLPPSITGKKRSHYNPAPLPGQPTAVPGRLKRELTREYSIAEGMSHEPMLAYSGKNVSMYTQVNDNATYSIGAYAIAGESAHLLGGSKSGEAFGKNYALERDKKKQKVEEKDVEEEEKKEKIEMHAEEQQVAAFKDQVAKNSHGLDDALSGGRAVVLHLHISKSPCSTQCQDMFDELLSDPKYASLEIQLYLETPYMANDPDEMIAEATALKGLLQKYPGRLAYKVVSAWNAQTAMADNDHPMKKLGGLEALIFELIGGNDENPKKARKRRERFDMLIGAGHLPAEGFVNALQ